MKRIKKNSVFKVSSNRLKKWLAIGSGLFLCLILLNFAAVPVDRGSALFCLLAVGILGVLVCTIKQKLLPAVRGAMDTAIHNFLFRLSMTFQHLFL